MRELEANWMEEIKPPVVADELPLLPVRGTAARAVNFGDGTGSLCVLSETVYGMQESAVLLGEQACPMRVSRELAAGLIPYLHCLLVHGHIHPPHVARFRPVRLRLEDGTVVEMTKPRKKWVMVSDGPVRYAPVAEEGEGQGEVDGG